MSVRRGPGLPPPSVVAAPKGRLHQVLSAGQEQKRVREEHAAAPSPPPVAPVKAVTGGGPYFYVGEGERRCRGGVYCDNDGRAVTSDGKTTREILEQQPPERGGRLHPAGAGEPAALDRQRPAHALPAQLCRLRGRSVQGGLRQVRHRAASRRPARRRTPPRCAARTAALSAR